MIKQQNIQVTCFYIQKKPVKWRNKGRELSNAFVVLNLYKNNFHTEVSI